MLFERLSQIGLGVFVLAGFGLRTGNTEAGLNLLGHAFGFLAERQRLVELLSRLYMIAKSFECISPVHQRLRLRERIINTGADVVRLPELAMACSVLPNSRCA